MALCGLLLKLSQYNNKAESATVSIHLASMMTIGQGVTDTVGLPGVPQLDGKGRVEERSTSSFISEQCTVLSKALSLRSQP